VARWKRQVSTKSVGKPGGRAKRTQVSVGVKSRKERKDLEERFIVVIFPEINNKQGTRKKKERGFKLC
jgi:hypothetical protein